jgi:hypothetical protein
MTITNGLYSILTEMMEGGHGHASGVIVLLDGRIAGGDSHFYYTGSYTADRGKWRGELTTNQHTKSVGVLPRFGGARSPLASAAPIPPIARKCRGRRWLERPAS